ncbi:MAG TPA: Ig-like domain-containing protein [Gemmatimonadales bacterium]
MLSSEPHLSATRSLHSCRAFGFLRLPGKLPLLVGLMACGESVGPSTTVDELVVSPRQVTLVSLGASAPLTAVARDKAGTPVPGVQVTWSSREAGVVTVSADGRVTAVANGVAAVVAFAGGVTDSATVTVAQEVSTVAVTPAVVRLAALGDTVRLAGTVTDANGHDIAGVALTWMSVAPSVATVDASGLVTAVGNGTTNIEAMTGDKGSAASVTVDQTPTKVTVVPSSVSFAALGDTAHLVASVADANGHPVADPDVVWISGDDAVASVSGTGIVRAESNGATQIVARVGNVADTIGVEVMQEVAHLMVTPGDADLSALGMTVQLTAAGSDANGAPVPTIPVSWVSRSPAVATVDESGLVTSVANGTALVVATSGDASDSATIRVAQVTAGITVTPAVLTLVSLGEIGQLIADVLDANGHAVQGAGVQWTTLDSAVVSVDENGTVTAVANGTTGIVAASGGIADTAETTVMQAPAIVTVTPDSIEFAAVGDTVRLSASVTDAGSSPIVDAVVEWSTLDEVVAAVSVDGVVRSEGNGTVGIVARSGSAADTASVRVAQVVAGVSISPAETTLVAFGASVELTAAVTDANGKPVAGALPTWTSRASDVATVDGGGVVIAVGNGVAVITADVEGLTDSAEVAVAQQVTGLDVSPSSLTLTALGAAVRVDAVPTDANGHPVDNAAVTWTSLAPAIASVDESGLVTAVSNGNATIVAITDGVADSVPATVAQRAKSVAVEPVDTTITGILDAVRFRGVGLDSLGNAVPDQMLSWSFVPSSTDTLLFVVDSAGLGRAFNDGAGSVVAEDSSGATGTTTLSVSAGVMPINYGDILTGTVSVSTQTVAYRPPEWRRGTVAWVAPSPLLAGALDPSLYVAPVRGVDTLVAGGDYDAVRGPEGPNPITGEELLVRLDDGATPATVVVAGGKGTIGGFTLGLQACRVLDTLSISSSTVSDSLTSQDCLVYNGTGDPKNNGGGNRPFAVLAPVTLAGGLTSAQLVVERLSITTDPFIYIFPPDGVMITCTPAGATIKNQSCFDDDSGGVRDARVVIASPSAGTYSLLVTTFGEGEVGPFRVTLTTNASSPVAAAPVGAKVP